MPAHHGAEVLAPHHMLDQTVGGQARGTRAVQIGV